MRKEFVVLIVSAAALAMTTMAIGQQSGRQHDHEQEQEQEKKQKYTCTMHPDVVMDHPGNCPKCGMKLVPMEEKKIRQTPNVQHLRPNRSQHAQHQSHQMHDASGMMIPHYDHGAHDIQPPSHEGHEMQMEMHSSIDLADPMSREGSGTSWLPDSSPMYGKMFMFGEDMLMLHGAIFPRSANVSTRRGDDRIDAPNWIMGMYSHPLGDSTQIGGRLMM